MEEPAFKYYSADRQSGSRSVSQQAASTEREPAEWETKVGKGIFYIIVALSIWFFYWLNGIQCPC